MSNLKLSQGDLVSIEPWDCEGVEMPWGWDRPKADATKSRVSRRKLAPGAIGMIVSFDHAGVDDYDTHYMVLVGDRKLSVPVRFINRMQG